MAILDPNYKGPKLDRKALAEWRNGESMKQAAKYQAESQNYGGGSLSGAASWLANKVANKVVDNPFVSARGITDVASSHLARQMASPEAKAFIPKPTVAQDIGAMAQTALLLYPGATVAKAGRFVAGSLLGKIAAKSLGEAAATGAASTLAKSSMARGIAKLVGNVASFGGAGYGYETSQKLIEGKTGPEAYTPGLQTAVSAALPFTPLAFTGASRVIGRAAQEAFGASTGAGMGVIRTAYEAAKEGGEKAAAFTKAMRGDTNPEDIVRAARESLGEIMQKRSTAYEAALTKVKGMTQQIDTTPIQNAIEQGLKKFGVEVTEEGLDFSRSTLRFNKKAQEEIRTIVDEMAQFGTRPGDNSPIGIDRLKRAFGDLYSDSSEARAFVANVTGATRKLLSQVPGYDAMARAYGESTGLIREIQKGLSLGDKASIDTAFRKLSTTLRTNNEFRQQLVAELDRISGGTLSAQIAGQQLSEKLPRGLAKIGLAGAGGIGLATGGLGVVALLKLAAVSSPRLIGEFANALGVSAKYFEKFLETIGVKAGKDILQKTRLPGDIILDSPFGTKLKESVASMKGKGGLSIQDVTRQPGYNHLLQEAGKYKSAEEFVKAQGTPVYHGSREKWSGEFRQPKAGEYQNEAIFVAPSENSAAYYDRGGGVKEAFIDKNAKIWNFRSKNDSAVLDGLKNDKKFTDYVNENWNYTPDEAISLIKEGRYDWVQRPEVTEFLRKNGYDGFVNIDHGGGETIGIFSNKKIKTKSQLTDLWKKAHRETKRGFGTGAGRPKTITKAQDSKITKSSLQEVLQDGAREYIKRLENAKTIDFDAIAKYQDLIKRAPKITDIQSLTRNIAELERKSKLKLMDEAIKIRNEVFDGLRKKNLKK